METIPLTALEPGRLGPKLRSATHGAEWQTDGVLCLGESSEGWPSCAVAIDEHKNFVSYLQVPCGLWAVKLQAVSSCCPLRKAASKHISSLLHPGLVLGTRFQTRHIVLFHVWTTMGTAAATQTSILFNIK